MHKSSALQAYQAYYYPIDKYNTKETMGLLTYRLLKYARPTHSLRRIYGISRRLKKLVVYIDQ